MGRGRMLGWIGAGGVFVFLSSWFGLTGPHMREGNWSQAAEFFADVWSNSAAADLAFIVGTLLAGFLAWRLLTRYEGLAGAGASIVLAGLAHWATYGVSYLLLTDSITPPDVEGIGDVLVFVGDWGKVGLILIAVLPSLVRWGAKHGHLSPVVPASLFKQEQA